MAPMRKPRGACSFLGCLKAAEGRGYCGSHLSQLRRGRDLTPLRIRRPQVIKTRRPHTTTEDAVLIPLTKGLTATVDLVDADLAQLNWTLLHSAGRVSYACARINGKRVLLHRLIAERAGMSLKRRRQVDHIDCDGLNNRRSNLRSVTPMQNKWNARISVRNTSGAKGVSRDKSGKWSASIRAKGYSVTLGSFDSLEAAAAAYAAAALKYRGEYARVQ